MKVAVRKSTLTAEHMQTLTFNSRKELQIPCLLSKRTSSIAMRTKIEVLLPEAHSNAWNILYILSTYTLQQEL